MFFSLARTHFIEFSSCFGPAPSLVPSLTGTGRRRYRSLPAERRLGARPGSCEPLSQGLPGLSSCSSRRGSSALSGDSLPSLMSGYQPGLCRQGGFLRPVVSTSRGGVPSRASGRALAPTTGTSRAGTQGWALGGIGCFHLSPRRLLTSALCPRRSPRPHAAPRDARPSSADASSRVQWSPSPPAVWLSESPPAPPACTEAPRGAAAWPPEGPPALNAAVVKPPPCRASFPLCPQTFISPWTNVPSTPRRGSWVPPCRSSPLHLSLSPSFPPFLFIVFILVTFPLFLLFISALKFFQGTFNQIFFFFYVKQ